MAFPTARIELPPDPSQLRTVREFVGGWAERCSLSEAEGFQARLVATEAVANAIMHSGGKNVELTCTGNEDGLRIEVRDRGEFKTDTDDRDGSGGRGISIMRALSRRLHIDTGDDGTYLSMQLGPDLRRAA